MLLPIYAYGQPVLKKVGEDIDKDYDGLSDLLANMWETMYNADGVGLAAPQIGKAIRIFLVDTVQTMEEGEEDKGIKMAFINAHIVEENGEAWSYEEGCPLKKKLIKRKLEAIKKGNVKAHYRMKFPR